MHGQVILSLLFVFCCFLNFVPSAFGSSLFVGNVVENFGHATPADTSDTLVRSLKGVPLAYGFFFLFLLLSVIQSVSRKLWSEAVRFRFSAHLSLAIPTILNLNLYLLPFWSIYRFVWFHFVPTVDERHQHTTSNFRTTNVYLSFFAGVWSEFLFQLWISM